MNQQRSKRCRRRAAGSGRVRAAVLEALDRRLLLSAGNPDATWNAGERVELSLFGPPGTFKAVAPRSDGTALVLTAAVGETDDLSGPGGLRVFRLTSDGSPDSGFGGGDGVTAFNVADGVTPVALYDLGVGNGFFVGATVFRTVQGSGGPQTSGDFLLARFTDDGELVPTFGGSGFRLYDLDGADGDDRVYALLSDPTQPRLVLVGTTTPLGSGVTRHALLRVDLSGNVDSDFGPVVDRLSSGAFTVDIEGDVVTGPQSAAFDPSGNLYLLTTTSLDSGYFAKKFDTAGLPASGFELDISGTGRVASGLVVDGSRVYVVGQRLGDLEVAAASAATGTRDFSFGVGGIFSYDSAFAGTFSATAGAIALRGSSGLTVAAVGSSGLTSELRVFGLTLGGAVDTTFASGQSVLVTSQSGGQVPPLQGFPAVVSGSGGTTVGVASTVDLDAPGLTPVALGGRVAKLTGSGALDAGFGSGGVATLPDVEDALPAEVDAVHVNAAGRVVAAFTLPGPAGGTRFGVAVYNRQGQQTALVTVGGDGLLEGVRQIAGVVEAQNNRYLVFFSGIYTPVPSAHAGLVVAAIDVETGTLDTDFGNAGFAFIGTPGPDDFDLRTIAKVSSNRVVVGGRFGDGRVLIAVNLDGELDTSFGSSGFQFGSGPGVGTYVALVTGPGDTLYALATRRLSGVDDVLVDRFLFNGSFDTTFGVGGTRLVPRPGGSLGMQAGGAVLGPSPLLYVAATVVESDGQRPVLLRLDSESGVLDTAFGNDGYLDLAAVSPNAAALSVVADRVGGVAEEKGYLVAGRSFDRPRLWRVTPDGELDNTYGQPSFASLQHGLYRGVVLDAASRPMPFGRLTWTGFDSTRAGVVERRRSVLNVRPKVTQVSTLPRPTVGAVYGEIRLTVRAPAGLKVDLNSLTSALKYTPPGGGPGDVRVATLADVDELDFSTVRATYRYTRAGSGPFTAADSGTYTFFTAQAGEPDVIRDDGGNELSPAVTFTVRLNFSGFLNPGDIDDSGFNSGLDVVLAGGDLLQGDVADTLLLPDGSVLLLTNYPTSAFLPLAAGGAGLAVTKLLPDGSLDAGFGLQGRAFFNHLSGVVGVVLLRDDQGRLYVVGNVRDGNSVDGNNEPTALSDVLVVRFNDDGTLDETFGGGGFTVIDVSATGGDDVVSGAALRPGGGLYIVGESEDVDVNGNVISDTGLFILRLDASGAVSGGFGEPAVRVTSGAAFYDRPTYNHFIPYFGPRTVAVNTNGALYIAGYELFNNPSTTRLFAVDSSGFPLIGSQYTTAVHDDLAATTARLVSLPGGSLLLAQMLTSADISVARLNADLTRDLSFGPADGRFRFNVDAPLPSRTFTTPLDIAVDDNGQIYVAAGDIDDQAPPGSTINVATFSLTSDGLLNTAFGGGLVTVAPERNATAVTVSAGGGGLALGVTRVTGGSTQGNATGVAVKLSSGGDLDTGFDNGTLGAGLVIPAPATAARPASTQVLTYSSLTGFVFAVSVSEGGPETPTLVARRFFPDGTGGGESIATFPTYSNYRLLGVYELTGGGYLLAMTVTDSDAMNARRLVLVRFDSDGTVDLTFGSGSGLQPVLAGNPQSVDMRAAVLGVSGDRIVLAGSIDGTPAFFAVALDGTVLQQPIFASGYDTSTYTAVGTDGGNGYFFALADETADLTNNSTRTRGVVERRDVNFDLVLDFGNGGVLVFDADPDFGFTEPLALLVDGDRGRLLVGGSYKLTADASLVGGFLRVFNVSSGAEVNGVGTTLLPPTATLGGVRAIALDSDNHYLLATAIDGLPRLVKAFAAGGVDENYGQGTLPEPGRLGVYEGVLLDSMNRPLVWGFQVQTTGLPQPGVIRRLVASTFDPPTATFNSITPANLPFTPSGGYTVRVTYAAAQNRGIDAATIAAANLRLFINGVESGTVTLLGTSPQSPRVIIADYLIVPPSGGFTFASQGSYEVRLSATSPVKDDLGQVVAEGVLTSFNVQFTPVGVAFVTPQPPALGDTELLFTVTYTPGAGQTLDLATLGDGNLVVDAPGGGTLTVTFVSSAPGSGNSRVVTYRLAAPGGAFDPADNGTYVFRIGPSPVRDTRNTPTDPDVTTLGSLNLAYGNPSATLTVAPDPKFGDALAEFTVRFSAPVGRTVNLSTLDGNEIRVTRPDGSVVVATLVSSAVVSGSGGREVDAVYRFGPTQSPFGFAAQGAYVVSTVDGTLLDDSGRPLLQSTLATLTLSYPRPTASATSPPPPNVGDAFVTFTVTFTPASGRTIDLTSIGNASVRVTRPDGSQAFATLLSSTTGSGGVVTASFRFTSTSGVFDNAAAGTYAVALLEGGVRDDRNVPAAFTSLFTLTFVASGEVGELVTVVVPPGPYAPGSPLFPGITLSNPSSLLASQPFSVRFFLVTASGLITLGDVAVDPLAAGETRTLGLGGRLSLPPSGQLVPGVYGFAGRTIAADGTLGPLVTAAQTLTVAARRDPRPGTLDPDFGDGSGIVTSFVPGPSITLVGAVSLPGSVIIAGGYTADGDFVLLRFLANGSRDLSFGDGGLVVVDVSGGFDLATTLVLDAQGRILLGGTSAVGESTLFAVVRFNADGTRDTSFASGGVLLYTPPGTQAARLRGIQTDRFGRPYLLGSVQASLTPGGPVRPHGVVIRLTPTGTVDGSFGNRGVVSAAPTGGRPGTLPFTDGQSELTSLLLLRDRIVVAGHSGNAEGTASRFLLAGLRYDGQLDRRFGRLGVMAATLGTTLDRITALLEAPGGGIYVGGSRGGPGATTAVLFRLTATGRTDRAFNRGQLRELLVDTAYGTVSSLLLSVNNTVLVTVATAASLAAANAGNIGTVAFRITPAGGNDPTFNGGSPLRIFTEGGPLVTASAAAIVGEFDAFVQSRQGAATTVQGGRVRSLATTPVTGGTAVSIAQLSPDGADLAVLLTSPLPDVARPGQRSTAVVTLSNIGSLVAAGRFSLTLVAATAEGADVNLVLRNVSTRLAAGSTRNLRVPFTLPRTTPTATYVLRASVNPLTFTDINPANNAATRPGEFVVTPTGTLIASAAPSAVALAAAPPSATATLFGERPVGDEGGAESP
ncbi:MAG: hypothetical protein ACK4PI_00910 [Tepidisphaerales bacterium]